MNTNITEGKKLSREKEAKRLLALDAARGLAVVGMYIQHFALNEWNSFVSGNTMILFMLCAGVSFTIMTQRIMNKSTGKKYLNTRILVRSVFIDFAGYVLILLNGPFGVVLTAYAMLYLLSIPLIKLPAKKLFALSGVLYFLSPPFMLIGMSLFEGASVLSDIAGGPLSALAWAPVFIMGMAIGRFDLHQVNHAIKFMIAGVVILIPVKLLETFVMPGIFNSYMEWASSNPAIVNAQVDIFAAWPYNTQPVMWQMLFVSTPQGGSACELLAGTAGSLILFGALCLMSNKYKLLLSPFCNVGKLALTLYVIQIVMGWLLQIAAPDQALMSIGSLPCADIIVTIVVILFSCILTRLRISPFENMMRKFESMYV